MTPIYENADEKAAHVARTAARAPLLLQIKNLAKTARTNPNNPDLKYVELTEEEWLTLTPDISHDLSVVEPNGVLLLPDGQATIRVEVRRTLQPNP